MLRPKLFALGLNIHVCNWPSTAHTNAPVQLVAQIMENAEHIALQARKVPFPGAVMKASIVDRDKSSPI
jgi:hypothetical protein